jgi:type IV pilus assembly protein PilC
MPSYAYRAVHASGRIASGEMAAVNENELAHYLNQSGLELIEAREAVERPLRLFFARRKILPRALAAFCARMHDLLLSGIAFPDALRDVRTTTDNRVMADALAQISQAIANGKGIAASFSLYPHLFPTVVTAIIGAGEKSGDMAVIFNFLARYAANQAQTRERMIRALRYPLFLFFIAGGAVAFMMTMVVPQIVQFLNGIEGHLPFATRVLVFVSAAFTDYGAYILTSLLIFVGAVFLARKIFSAFAIALDGLLLRLPVIGNVIIKTTLARFTNSFAILFRSGCDVPLCLQQAGETIGNRALRVRLEGAERRVLEGASLSLALDGVVPPSAVGLLRTGERSGDLGKCLDDITIAYDREAQNAVDAFIGLLEPCLTLMIGGLLAWTVVAVLGPLYGSLSVLGGRM